MKFAIYKTSSHECIGIRNFNTTEELIRFKEENENEIIIMDNPTYQEDIEIAKVYHSKVDTDELVTIPYAIEIYDDYRE